VYGGGRKEKSEKKKVKGLKEPVLDGRATQRGEAAWGGVGGGGLVVKDTKLERA